MSNKRIFLIGIVISIFIMTVIVVNRESKLNKLEKQNKALRWVNCRVIMQNMEAQILLRDVYFSENLVKTQIKLKNEMDRAIAYSIKETWEAYSYQLKASEDMRHLRKWIDNHPDRATEIMKEHGIKLDTNRTNFRFHDKEKNE